MVELAVEAEPVAGGWMTFGGRGAFVNKACGLGLEGEVPAESAERIRTFFRDWQVEPTVEICPFVHPTLLEALAEAGFQLHAFENVLVRPLDPAEDLRRALSHPWPEGVVIDRIDASEPAQVETYVRVSSSGFFAAGTEMSDSFFRMSLKAAGLPGADCFVARVDGEVVGAAGCANRQGVTSLYGASVLPAFRRRGIQQALIAARLERGAQRGSRRATIVSHPGIPTERNAARLGFRMAYTRSVLVCPGAGPVRPP